MDNNKDSLNDLDFVLQGYMAYLKLIYDKEIDPQWVKMDMNIKFRIYKDKLISFFQNYMCRLWIVIYAIYQFSAIDLA